MDRDRVEVTEYTDAMCSWAWGTEPKLRLLQWRFDDQIAEWRHVMGHLVEDEHMPERDPVAGASKLQGYWKVVCDQTGMPMPDPLRRTTTGSRASGVAAKAAQRQGRAAVERVLRRLREATFVHGEPPDSETTAVERLRSIDGLDHDKLVLDMADDGVTKDYQDDQDQTRSPNDHVLNLEGDRPGIGRAREARDGRMRFVFPTLVFAGGGEERTVPGWMPYAAYEEALFAVGAERTDRTESNPTPEEAFARWPSIAEAEFTFLCGPDAAPPPETVIHRWGGGAVYLTPDEAAAIL